MGFRSIGLAGRGGVAVPGLPFPCQGLSYADTLMKTKEP